MSPTPMASTRRPEGERSARGPSTGRAIAGTISGVIGSLVLVLGCREAQLAPLRSVTYPPDFHYLTRDEIQGTMAEFARSVDALDAILMQEGGAGSADRETVVGILEQLRLQARHLESGAESNHPGLHQDAPRFTRDVDRALVGARRDPPDYSGAARIAGSCTACHAPRHPGAA